jgi:hypothetical protein
MRQATLSGPIISVVLRKTPNQTPQEKKRLSLTRDRRNAYGANDKASRRLVPRSRQMGQKRLRRAVTQELSQPITTNEDVADAIGADAADAHASKTRRRFKKVPDQPLAEALNRKRERSLENEERARRSTSTPPRSDKRRLPLMGYAAIRAFCAASAVLARSDVTCSERTHRTGGTIEVGVMHNPSGAQVTVRHHQDGGLTRAQAQDIRSKLYQHALRELEDDVRARLRDAQRRAHTLNLKVLDS